MARRRKSSKSIDAAGVLLLMALGIAVAIYNFLAAHFAESALIAGSAGAVWVAARFLRSRQRAATLYSSTADASSPNNSKPLTPAAAGPQMPGLRQPSAARAQIAPPRTEGVSTVSTGSKPAKAPPEAARPAENVYQTNIGPLHVEVRSEPSTVISFKPDPEPNPPVRITPIVDPPKSEAAPTKSWFQRDPSEKKVGNAKWVRAGETVSIQGVEVSTGWFYLGTEMNREYFGTEGCLINPKLPIAKQGERPPATESYNSSYSNFTPSERRQFLEWMAGGRRSPDAGDSLVRVFLEGLEYRVFKQGVRSEIPQLVDEAERILDVYGQGNSFSWIASRFVSYASAFLPSPKRPDTRFAKAASFTGVEELSPHVRVFIGKKLVYGERITAEDALVWAIALPNVWLRTPAKRCREEFEALWALRFNDYYPGGFDVKRPKAMISLSYPTDYGRSPTRLHGDFEKLPDIASDSASASKLKELVESCTNELDAYSRFLGRHAELAGNPRADLFLPNDLWARKYERSVEIVASMLGDGELFVSSLGEMTSAAEFPLAGASGKELAATLDRLASALRLYDIGIEPNGPHAEPFLSLECPVGLFRMRARPDGDVEDDRAPWRDAIDIAILAAATAGSVTDAARIAATESIASDFRGLDPMRIWAYAAGVQPAGSRLAKVLKAAGDLPVADRQSMARCAVSAALSASGVSPPTVKFLERLYAALRFTSSDLYAALHRGDAERPAATASKAGLDAVSRALGDGASPPAGTEHIVIDPEKLALARASTLAVSKILADVFVEDTPAAAVAPVADAKKQSAPRGGSVFPGLDAAHADLLSTLVDAGALERKAFEARAKELRLFADGAIDHINDWAFDRFDEMLVADGDTVTLVAHLRDRVIELRGKEQ